MKKTIVSLSVVICLLLAQSAHAQVNVTKGTYKTIYDMLKDVPGVEVSSGNTGRAGTIRVRGTGTLMASAEPLFVIDGAVYSGDISNLNPNDIANISVLKDGGSTAAYGSQGANGVIVITTKKGAGAGGSAAVTNHTESAYTYFIDHKTALRVYGQDDNVIIEGVIIKQRNDSLIFIRKRKDFPVAISSVKRVEMIPQQ